MVYFYDRHKEGGLIRSAEKEINSNVFITSCDCSTWNRNNSVF